MQPNGQHGSTLNSLELLTIIDIIKNEDLYRDRIEEIQKQEKHLAESRFIAATVEKANKLKAEAEQILQLAKESREKAAKEAEDYLDELENKFKKFEAECLVKVEESRARKDEAERRVGELAEKEKNLQTLDKQLQLRGSQLNQQEAKIADQAERLRGLKAQLEEILRKI